MIPYGKQEITQTDIDAVVNVLKSDFLTQGPQVPAFEKSLTDYTGAEFAFAMNSATSALHVACMALGLSKGEWLWTTPISFVASANCGRYCGANVDFVDIDEATYNLCPKKLKQKLEKAKLEKCLPKVLVAVHLCGQPCDMKAIHLLSKEYDFAIIEDASHAIGGKYLDEPIGNCRYSDITVFSFHPVKIVTTAEGGVALTNSKILADKMSLYRSHGVTRDESLMTELSHGGWYYQQVELGYNYRMTELQAALGINQMLRLDDFVTSRHKLAKRYDKLLNSLPLTCPYQIENSYSGLHLYVIRLDLTAIKINHREVFEQLRNNGIGVNLHYIPIHIHPYYKNLGFSQGDFPNAEKYYQEAISLPIFHIMSLEQQDKVVSVLADILES